MALSEERIAEIQGKLQGLSQEEQKKKLDEILAELPEEEVKELQKQQCPFCLIAEGKIKAKKVYEDDFLLGVLDINPASRGHVVLFPKEHYALLAQVEDELVAKIFVVANKISSALYGRMEAQGTNIFVANGVLAGQNSPHVLIHIIPRYENDKVGLRWQGKKMDEAELEEVQNKIGAVTFEEVKKAKEEKKTEERVYDDTRYPSGC